MTRRSLYLVTALAAVHPACSAEPPAAERGLSGNPESYRFTTSKTSADAAGDTSTPEPDPNDLGYRALTEEEKAAKLWYWGWKNAQAGQTVGGCDEHYPMMAVPPEHAQDGKRYPLFLYFTGTRTCLEADQRKCDNNGGNSKQWGPSGYNENAAQAILGEMARGDNPYYAFSVDYANFGTGNAVGNVGCIYGSVKRGGMSNGPVEMVNPERNVLEVACRIPGVDCSTITVAGYSQGANIAIWAYDYNVRLGDEKRVVKAAWLTGYSTLPYQCFTDNGKYCKRDAVCDASATNCSWWTDWPGIPTDALRVVNGNEDGANNNSQVLNWVTGESCVEKNKCLHDEHGWYLVTKEELSQSIADHCWFDHPSGCQGSDVKLNEAWLKGTEAFSLTATAKWLKDRAAK